MSQIGIDFANQWIAENIRPTFFVPEGGRHPETQATLARFLADSKENGISRREIEEDIGDLSDFLSAALEDATEAEVERLDDDED